MNKLKSCLVRSRAFTAWLLMAIVMALVVTGQQAKAVFTPVEVSVADPIAQVLATAADVLPYVLTVVGASIVFRLVRKWIR